MMIALTDNTSKHRIIVQALQNNFIDCFSFRDKKEIGSSSTTEQPTEQGPEGLTAVQTQHTYQTDKPAGTPVIYPSPRDYTVSLFSAAEAADDASNRGGVRKNFLCLCSLFPNSKVTL